MKSLLNHQQLQPLLADLAAQGLVLATAVSVRQLPDTIWLDAEAAYKTYKKAGTLLLLGHGGRLFWQQYQQSIPAPNDPVDHFSAEISMQALQHYVPAIKHEILFPSPECPVNLMALGRAMGWHSPSPLGMGINADYGMWSAYRALWWLDTEIEEAVLPVAHDVCSECLTQNCLQACPADALSIGSMPNLQKCADSRLQPDSHCEATCLARMACPIALEHRYTSQQMAYHYDLQRSQIHLFSSGAKHG